jgi:hypothetical protein
LLQVLGAIADTGQVWILFEKLGGRFPKASFGPDTEHLIGGLTNADPTEPFRDSFERYFNDGERWTPFLPGGYADDGGGLLQRSVSVGSLYQPLSEGGQLGVGLNWGQPNKTTFGPGLDNQIMVEAFYRLQVTPQFALKPNVEYIKDPALNSENSSSWVVGLRARLAL